MRVDTGARLMGEPTPQGRFGEFGGRFVPETVPMAAARSSGGLELRTASAPMV